MSKGLFITGTDTNVGKTLITASIAWKLSKRFRISVMKPFATGDKYFSKEFKSEDLSILCKAISIKENQNILNPSFYNLPSSPYMAYKLLNAKPPNINLVVKNLNYLRKEYDLVLVEGIGGLMVPLKRNYMLLDFIKRVKMDVIMVTTPRLGTLNHTLMSVKLCKLNSISLKAIIINKMPKRPSIVEKNIPFFIEELSNIPVVGIIPNIEYVRLDQKVFQKVSDLIDIGFVNQKSNFS